MVLPTARVVKFDIPRACARRPRRSGDQGTIDADATVRTHRDDAAKAKAKECANEEGADAGARGSLGRSFGR